LPPANRAKGWALITGASSGIGLALAAEFAKHGHPIILVARDKNKLDAVARELKKQFSVPTLILISDLTRPGAVAEIEKELKEKNLEIEILVNNAGFGVHGGFLTTDLARELSLVQIQIAAMLGLSKICLKSMASRRHGKILNVASVYAYAPVPYQSVYAGTKSFLLAFSESLADEVKDFGITVTTLCPGITRTDFRTRAGMREKKSHFQASAESVASYGFGSLMAGKRVAVPGWPNRIFVTIVRHLPGSWLSQLMIVINRLRGVNARPPFVR
jgi:short-subunit dehydrogenase